MTNVPATRARTMTRFSALQRAENSSTPDTAALRAVKRRFSALQRAENSSISTGWFWNVSVVGVFQCSSASRKFLKRSGSPDRPFCLGFSALQRAENSSIASTVDVEELALGRFSALQRAENSSMVPQTLLLQRHSASFQCSSASRKFLNSKAPNRVYGQYRFQCSSASRKFLN